MTFSIETLQFLLLIAALVSMVTRRMQFPYTVGLLLTGIGLAFIASVTNLTLNIHLTKQLIFDVLLPPLIFEAAFHLDWHELKQDLLPLIIFATLGVLLSATLTMLGMHYLVGWSWVTALIFGVLIAATDPVAVIATIKDIGLTGRLKLLIESESLFNDGTAAVLFGIALSLLETTHIVPVDIGVSLLVTTFGGLVCGLLIASIAMFLTRKTEDHLLELAFTTIVAYMSFLIAESFHCSGVLATLAAGLLVGQRGNAGFFTEKGKEVVSAFWEFAAFIANSLIFLLMGLQVAHQKFDGVWVLVLIAIVVVLISRAFAIYPTCLLFSKSRYKFPMSFQHVLFWGGLRGALALALALGLPDTMAEKPMITTVVFGVVAFSLLIQGTTIPLLLKNENKSAS